MSRVSYKTLFTIVFILLAAVIFLVRINGKVAKVSAAWWNDSWMYRQAINVSSHNSSESNVYIITTINIGNTSKTKANDGDFRFLNSTGQQLSYYIASGVGTTNITFHIQFSSFPAGAQTIYAYYGNPSATNGFSGSDFSTQASNYTIGSTNAEETGGGPVAWWKFDEGVGTTAYDSSANHVDGSLVNTSWQSSDQCISGRCLAFNGSSSYVNISNNANLNPTTNFTIEAWIKTNSVAGSTNYNIFAKQAWGNNQGYRLFLGGYGTNNSLILGVGNSVTQDESDSGQHLTNLNTWYHAVGTFSNGVVKIYVNGKLKFQKTTSVTSIVNTSSGAAIGAHNGPSEYFPGTIDDVKFYPYTRSDSQILQDYTSGLAGMSTAKGSNSSIGGRSPNGGLSDGLVAYWKMDEGTGTTSADSSGNNNLLTFSVGSSAPGWGIGKFGAGVSFPATQTYLSATLPAVQDFTISTWINLNEVNREQHFAEPTNVQFYIGSDNKPHCGPGSSHYANSSTTLSSGNWYYVTCTYSNSNTNWNIFVNGVSTGTLSGYSVSPVSPIIIGDYYAHQSGYYLNGYLDEVRLYNRALSQNEITRLYNYAPGPVGYWNFEEGVGTTAFDRSGNGYNGVFAAGTSAPTWSAGKYGKGLSFNGTNNYIDAGTGPAIQPTKAITLEYWMYPTEFASGGQEKSLVGWQVNGKGLYTNLWNSSLFSQFWDGSTWQTLSFTVPSLNQWYHISITYDSSAGTNNYKIYSNGILQNQTTKTGPIVYSGGSFRIGYDTTTFYHGLLDDVKIYNYARTQSQILADMGTGLAQKSPLAWYKFDEGSGTVANNSSSIGSTLNGTLLGSTLPAWTTGKNNKALSFNGLNSYVDISSPNYDFANKDFTISLWAYYHGYTSHGSAWNCLFGRDDAFSTTGYGICTNSSNTAQFSAGNIQVDSGINISNGWHHIAAVHDSVTPQLRIYVDGAFKKAATYTNQLTSKTTAITAVGEDSQGSRQANGLIDDLKIYSYALSADEIKQDYNNSSTVSFSNSTQTIGSTTTSLDYCVPGSTDFCSSPIAEWKFEEGSGTTAFDTSGNNYNGILSGTTIPTWTTGKIGKALSFNGNSSWIDTGTQPAYNITNTISFGGWVYPKTFVGSYSRMIDKGYNTQYQITFGNADPISYSYCGLNIGSTWRGTSSSNIIPTNSWTHIECTYDGDKIRLYNNGQLVNTSASFPGTINTSTNKLAIGSNPTGGENFNGKIDNIRIYNYARTPAQVAYDYNRGAPVAWYKLDECQGSTAFDSSGLGNTGTISIGTSGTQVSVGTCGLGDTSAWSNGKNGKTNSSINLDGTDDFIQTGTSGFSPSSGSVTLWLKPSVTPTNDEYLYMGSRDPNRVYLVRSANTNYFGAVLNSTTITTTTIINPNTWSFVTLIWNLGNYNLYFNGSNIKNGSYTNLTSLGICASIGCYNACDGVPANRNHFYQGQIDDVRIYNYPLTGTQIQQIYNGGAVNFQ